MDNLRLESKPTLQNKGKKQGEPLAESARKHTEQLPIEQLPTGQLPIEQESVHAHFAILQMGVNIWNRWRLKDPHIIPNLQGADLSNMPLENINLSRANLRGANLDNALLFDADFQRADMRGTSLVRTTLIGASLHRANLLDANLEHAYLHHCDLSDANLTGAFLKEAELRFAVLTGATLVNARLADAELAESHDLTVRQLKVAKDAEDAFLNERLQYSLADALQASPEEKLLNPTRTRKVSAEKGLQKSSIPEKASVRREPPTPEIVPSISITFQPRLAS
ncbi:MAG: pentapeptide repeat-containing protein [Cyanobacteria bacterium J06560_2]